MPNLEVERKEIDAVTDELRWASMLQAVGWLLLLFDGIVVNFVWVGFRSGSYFWLYWTIIEGSIGFVLALGGSYLKTKSGRQVSRLGYENEEQQREAA